MIQKDKSATLATNNDQYLFVPVAIENHPADSRVNIDDSGKVQTLTSRMGTGGGNVPMVMEPFCKSARARSADDATTWKHAEKANTLNTFDQGEARANEVVVCLQGNGIDRSDTAGCNGKGWKEEVSYMLNTIDRPAVAYRFYPQMKAESQCFAEGIANTIVNGTNPGYQNGVIYRQGGFADYVEGEVGTLKASGGDLGGESENLIVEKPRCIVRRLTPTECARLQGFPDRWGDIDHKEALTDEEYAFWLDVRNTHAAINGKQPKTYSREQMLTWYNKLHTDSAEYKMWGNGIALPCVLYVMQGIAEAE